MTSEGSENGKSDSGFSFTDKRRIDPETGEVRESAAGGQQPAGEQGESAAPETPADPAEQVEPELDVEIPDDASELDGESLTDTEALTGDAKLAAERLEDLQRINAEYASYRMRAAREQEKAKDAGVIAVVEALIPVLDEVKLAREHGDVTGPFETHVSKLTAALEKLGVESFGAPGDEFDPALHEALMQQESDEVEVATVSMVMQPGYRLGERLLRAARVGVTSPTE